MKIHRRLSLLLLVSLLGVVLPVQAEGFLFPKSGFADTVEKLLPTVVNISSTQKVDVGGEIQDFMQDLPQFPPGSPFEEFFKEFGERNRRSPEQSRKATSLGSGFIIDPAGYIVTNGHVIQDADEINVILQDNTNLKAELVGLDKKTDLAVLKVKPAKPLPAAKWGDSDKARVGDVVLAIGNPYSLGGSVTAGIISARARDIQSGPYDDYLQTDAAINRGNSGGPMFNVDGDVIGINTAIFSPSGGSVGIGFAIPSNLAKEVVQQLKTTGKTRRGWLGVRIQVVTDEIAESLKLDKARGAMVADVTAGGPAEKAGVQTGDVIVKFDGKDVPEMRRLPRIVAETPVDKAVPVEVWRNGRALRLNVKVGELESTEDKDEQAGDGSKGGSGSVKDSGKAQKIEELGFSVSALTPENRKKYDIKSDIEGVLVTDIVQDSKAQERGIVSGDVIMEVGQQEVATISDVLEAVKKASDGKPLLFLLSHKGDPRFVALQVQKKSKEKKK